MFSCCQQFWGNLRQNRYVIIMLKITSTIAIWYHVFLHTQNNIFHIEPENRNKHLPGWRLLQSAWINLNNYILQQNILASGKLFNKICSRRHENECSQVYLYRITCVNLRWLHRSLLTAYHKNTCTATYAHSFEKMWHKMIIFPPNRGCICVCRAIWGSLQSAFMMS